MKQVVGEVSATQVTSILAVWSVLTIICGPPAQSAQEGCPAQIKSFEVEMITIYEKPDTRARSQSKRSPRISGDDPPIEVHDCDSNMYLVEIEGISGWVLDLDVTTDAAMVKSNISTEGVPFSGPKSGTVRTYGEGSDE